MPGTLTNQLALGVTIVCLGAAAWFALLRASHRPVARWQTWGLWIVSSILLFGAVGAARYHFDASRVLSFMLTGAVGGIVAIVVMEWPFSHKGARQR